MSTPSYSAYKDSGIEWLGEVPQHWAACRIKDTTYLKGRIGWKGLKSDEYLEHGHAYLVTGTDFGSKFISWDECHFVDRFRYDDDPFIQLRDGDLLITKDGTIGKLALVSNLDRPACLNSGIFLVRPRGSYLTEFMYWVLSSNVFRTFCDLASLGSTIQHLYQNVFERFVFPVPTIEEQRAIANFLDLEIGKIDALVAEQQRLIDLLKEKRQAVISQAVTKGLDPRAPMKGSGVEWLGTVPCHWAVCRRGYYASVENGSTPSRDNLSYWTDGTVPWVSSSEVNQYVIREPSEFITSTALAECSLRLLPERSVLVGLIGQGRTRGLSALLSIPAAINQNVAAVITDPKLLPKYLHYSLQAAYEFMRECGRGGNQAAMNCEILASMRIALPPEDEQAKIVWHLDEVHESTVQLTAECASAGDVPASVETFLAALPALSR